MRLVLLASAALAAAVAVAACDGGSTGATPATGGPSNEPAGSPGQEDDYCKAQASHETCNGGTAGEPCREDARCIYGRLMSRTAADAYFACYSAPSCKSDDTCAAEAGKAAGGGAADAYVSECRAKVDSCEGTKIDGDLCFPTIFAYPSVRDAAQACLGKACDELVECFRAAVAPIRDCK